MGSITSRTRLVSRHEGTSPGFFGRFPVPYRSACTAPLLAQRGGRLVCECPAGFKSGKSRRGRVLHRQRVVVGGRNRNGRLSPGHVPLRIQAVLVPMASSFGTS